MATGRISVRISEELRRELEKASRASGAKEAELVREALERYLQSLRASESCYDLARRIGVIGSISNAPRHLSTNRKYLRGFGRK